MDSHVVCKDGFEINTETGEVLGECYDVTDLVEDHDLVHYSVTPPVPPGDVTRIRRLAKENAKSRNLWKKGHWVEEELKKVHAIIKFLERLYESLR